MKARTLLLASSALVLMAPAYAQTPVEPPATAQTAPVESPEASGEIEESGEIVVTAVARGVNRLDSAVSVSSLSASEIDTLAPRSVAEIFRAIPGIRSESSGGEGNANIAVRGLPVASGGAKFLQLQEDGLPVLEYGDITFGNADIFLRADFNVARVEAVRGGSASTFASNSPGGVINLISKTGEQEGGSIQGTVGLQYEEYRVDFDYGAPISDTLRFHIGGFYRQGEGPRRAGYDGNEGGQIKLNITKEFERGFVRVYAKYLNDRAIGYLPNPVIVTGTDSNPAYREIPNFSINQDTLHSRFLTQNITLDGNNQPTVNDIRDGQHPVVGSLGFESEFDVGGGFTVTNRFRYSDISGRFISNFPAAVGAAGETAEALGGPGATLEFANGPNAGQIITDPASLNGNGLLAQIVIFDTRLNSLDNVTNDFRISRDFTLPVGSLSALAGFYKSRQTVDTDWLGTSVLLEVQGDGNAALINLRDADGTLLTQDGFFGFGARFFGNCCRRSYDVDYSTNAPFVSLNYSAGALTLDGSARYDFGDAQGSVSGAELGGGRVGLTSFDINSDGDISSAEE